MSQLYYASAKVLRTMDLEKRGFRDVFYTQEHHKDLSVNKQVFALTCNFLKHKSAVNAIIARLPDVGSNFLRPTEINNNAAQGNHGSLWSKRRLRRVSQPDRGVSSGSSAYVSSNLEGYVYRVMICDMLYGKGLRGSGAMAKRLKDLESVFMTLKKQLQADQLENESIPSSIQCQTTISRYLRVMVSRITTSRVLEVLQNALQSITQSSDTSGNVTLDRDIPDLIRVSDPKLVSLVLQHALVKEGLAVFQDKASCVSAIAAGIRPGMSVLDVCAAPGSKTLHCIDLLRGEGRVVAVERDHRRAQVLGQRVLHVANLSGPFSCLQCRKPATDTSWTSKHKTEQSACSSINSTMPFHKRRNITPLAEDDDAVQDGPRYVHYTNSSGKLTVTVICRDFLSIDAKTLSELSLVCEECLNKSSPRRVCSDGYFDVILVDPSCSGSGLPLHHHHNEANANAKLKDTLSCTFSGSSVATPSDRPPTETKRRVQQLASFQKTILKHALRTYVSSKHGSCVLYSTCSIDIRENEIVVLDTLRELSEEGNDSVDNNPSRRKGRGTTQHCYAPQALLFDWIPKGHTLQQQEYLEPAQGPSYEQIQELYAKSFHSNPKIDDCRGFYLCKIRAFEK